MRQSPLRPTSSDSAYKVPRNNLTSNNFFERRTGMTSENPSRISCVTRVATCLCVTFSSAVFASAGSTAAPTTAKPYQSFSEILAAAPASAWRTPDPDNVIYLELAAGRVVMELAPHLAPNHVANIRTLIREKYFDGLAIVRSQDNYVVQWGDPDEKNPRAIKQAKTSLTPEFTRQLTPKAFAGMPFDRLPDVDGYAPQVGFASGFHAGRNPKTSQIWAAHCYGALGVGRGNALESGSGSSLYVVTGHAPRHLDRNITLVGRVLQGMPLLSVLPRGTRPLGFYATEPERVPIRAITVEADVAPDQRSALEVIRTDSDAFKRGVEALRNRGGDWFKVPAGHVELCNIPIAVRPRPTPAASADAPKP
jgi:cyclophilin family peptidyl-prolyl cis-trans isomerase